MVILCLFCSDGGKKGGFLGEFKIIAYLCN